MHRKDLLALKLHIIKLQGKGATIIHGLLDQLDYEDGIFQVACALNTTVTSAPRYKSLRLFFCSIFTAQRR